MIALSVLLDTGDLRRQAGFTGLIGNWSPAILRAIMAFAALSITFGLVTSKGAFQRVSGELAFVPISRGFLAGHVCAMSVFCALSYFLFGHAPDRWQTDLVASVWMAAGIFAIVLAAVAFVPPRLGRELLCCSGKWWLLASLGAATVCLIGDLGQFLWRPLTGATFEVVRTLLRPFISDLIANPGTMAIGSDRFYVIISPECSGLEGAGLMVVFTSISLWLFRKECRFPRALLIIPAGVLLVWVLNSLRIAALILVGNAGAASIALGGFHSQAGWLAFNAVALGFTYALRRAPWLNTERLNTERLNTERLGIEGVSTEAAQTGSVEATRAENPTAWYIVPLLVTLAAAMVARAISDGFEWLYPLRFFAATAALLYFRRRYVDLDWTIGWVAPVAGITVAVIWLGFSLATGTASDKVIGPALASLSTPARASWIVFRMLAATITVRLAEELASRGYLLRRLISPDFEQVDSSRFTVASVIISSIAFGLLHGNRWLAGTVAGLIYAWTFRHRGSIGDAVAAHAITNALLSVCVLSGGNWQLL